MSGRRYIWYGGAPVNVTKLVNPVILPQTVPLNILCPLDPLSFAVLQWDIVNDIAFEFQNAAIDCLVKKSLKACLNERSKSLVLSGGVAANKYLREELEKHKGTINLYYPDKKHCTDNGLMIAFAGFQKIKELTKDFSIDVAPRWSLENVQ